MVNKIFSNKLKKLGTEDLQRELVGVTIGGSTKGKNNATRKGLIFGEYVRRAFSDIRVIKVTPISTAASLNSVSAIIQAQFADGEEKSVFAKVHVESNTGKLNPLGAEEEYKNAEVLEDAGWPVIKPLYKSNNSDYPLLIYPVVTAEPLFDVLENSHISGRVQVTDDQINWLRKYNQRIGKREKAMIKPGTRKEAIDAPVQTLFLRRFVTGGRIDQWYRSDTVFKLPGLNENKFIIWRELLDKSWNINGIDYDITLRKIIEQARKSLSFTGEDRTYLTVLHGDDHAGNVRLTTPPVVFDPAFAGWNPVALDVKALAHTGFLPMAAMYYSPKKLDVQYRATDKKIIVTTNIESLPMYETHTILAQQIIDTRVIPVMKAIQKHGANITKEKERIQSALAGCTLLTVNIAQLLEQQDGRAVGLLPMAVMLQQLKGLPVLDYFRDKIKSVERGE